jgi:hypothetical protein
MKPFEAEPDAACSKDALASALAAAEALNESSNRSGRCYRQARQNVDVSTPK